MRSWTSRSAGCTPRPLDRSRPLWELYLITGLAKKRAAVYTKIHHAAIDGASGAELLTVLFDLTAARPRAGPRPGPSGRPPRRPLPALAVKAVARLAWRPVQTVRVTNELVKVLPDPGPGGEHGGRRHAGAEPRRRHRDRDPGRGRAPATPFQPVDHAAPPVSRSAASAWTPSRR